MDCKEEKQLYYVTCSIGVLFMGSAEYLSIYNSEC